MILLFVCGDHVAPDVIALRGESDTERAEDGEELVEADTGGVTELEGRQQALGHARRRGELGTRETLTLAGAAYVDSGLARRDNRHRVYGLLLMQKYAD